MSSRSRYNTPPNAPGHSGDKTQHEVEKMRRGVFERGLDVTGAAVIQNAPVQLTLKQASPSDLVELEYRGSSDAILAKLQHNASTFFWNLIGILGVSRIVGIYTAAPADSLVVDTAGSLGVGTATVGASAKLQVESTSKGFLPPRMTTAQRVAISSPAEGLQVYDTDLDCLFQMGPLTWLPVSRSPHVLDLTEDFLGGSSTNNTIGELGWLISGGTTNDANKSGRPGITTRTANAAITSMFTKAASNPIFAADLKYLCWIVKTDASTIADTEIRVGLSSNVNSNTPASAIHFKYDAAADTNWQCQTYNSGSATTTNSGVAVAADTWYRFEATYDGTTVRFYINGTLVASHTTNIPTAAMRWYSQLESTTAADRNLWHDYTRLVLTMAR